MRLAYLCNVYPAVSHSFVRREIEGVEGAGHDVARFTIRPPPANLRDEADVAEARRTEVVLAGGLPRLCVSAVGMGLANPLRGIKAVRAAMQLSAPGLAARARHLVYWMEAAWLARRLDKLGVEHLHVHFGTNPTAVAAIARVWGGPTFSFTAHGPDEFDAPVALSLPAKVRQASFVAGISSFGRSQLMRWSDPFDWQKIEVIRCGLSADFLEAAQDPAPPDSREFVCVARLSAQKGLPLLIGACAKLRQAGENFHVTIIGDGELRPVLEAQLSELGLADCVRLVGVQSSSEIREHLSRARAFLLPSFAEGLPVVLMEALALGRPVITTAIAGIPELVQPDCGWLIAPGSEEEIVRAMREALRTDSHQLAVMGSNGRERVRQMHDANRNASLLIDAIIKRRPATISTR